MSNLVYFDHNATTPVEAAVRAQVPTWLEASGNPSSIHWAGREPKALLRHARAKVAAAIHAEPLEIIFTSGGSEANALALTGLTSAGERNEIVISAAEHPSLRKTAESLRTRGFEVRVIEVDRAGFVDLDKVRSLVGPRTALVSVMLANNETGVILPVAEIAALAHRAGARVHCDAVQGLGKVQIDVRTLGVDYLSLSAHKFYALKGVGALFVKRGAPLGQLICGGGQERGRRAGTENVVGVASFGAMAERVGEIESRGRDLAELRDHFERRVSSEIGDVAVTHQKAPRLPNTSSLVIDAIDGETLLMNLDVRGYAVSTGAACSAGSPEPSPALIAMGLSRAEASSSLRVSFGWGNTLAEVDRFVDELKQVVKRLRGFHRGERAAGGL